VKVTGIARRLFKVEVEPYTSVLPNVFEVVDPSWITVTVLLVTPVPATVTVADLELDPVFAEVAVQVIVPLFVPDIGDTVSQLPSSVILQVVFDVMLKVPFDPEPELSVIVVGDTFKYCVKVVLSKTQVAFDSSPQPSRLPPNSIILPPSILTSARL
jgi:hypothetical protein